MDEEAACRRNVSEALAYYLDDGRLSKSKVSSDTGIARQTIDDILNQDRLISTETLIKLAVYFGISAGALLDGVPQYEGDLPDAHFLFSLRLIPTDADLSENRLESIRLTVASALGSALGGISIVNRRLRGDRMTMPLDHEGRLRQLEAEALRLGTAADRTELLEDVLDILLTAEELPGTLRDRMRAKLEPGQEHQS